jgi:hypothetical protein
MKREKMILGLNIIAIDVLQNGQEHRQEYLQRPLVNESWRAYIYSIYQV